MDEQFLMYHDTDQETWSTLRMESQRQDEIQKLQEAREQNNLLFSDMFGDVIDQDENIKKMGKNVTASLKNGLDGVKELAKAKKQEYGLWKCVTYGIGGCVVGGVAGLASSIPVATAAAGGAIVAGGSRMVYSDHKRKICNRELAQLERLRVQIDTNYQYLINDDCVFPEDDLDCDNDAFAAQTKIVQQGELLSAIRYQLIDVFNIISAGSPFEIELSYPGLEEIELQNIKQYKTGATDSINADNKEEVLDSIAHNVAQDLKVAQNIASILPSQIAACAEIEERIAEVLKQLAKRNKEIQKKLDSK